MNRSKVVLIGVSPAGQKGFQIIKPNSEKSIKDDAKAALTKLFAQK